MNYNRIKDATLALSGAITLMGMVSGLALAQDNAATLTASPDSAVNLRSGPSTDFAVVHTGVAGDAVTILESYGEEGSTWYWVQFEDSAAMGWVRADLVLNGDVVVSDRCHEELAVVRSELTAVRNGFLRAIHIGYNDLAPADRPASLLLALGGSGQASILSSPQFMLSLSQEVIQYCSAISSVQFSSDSSGWHDIYGLIDGEVTGFNCVELQGDLELNWGEYFCEL